MPAKILVADDNEDDLALLGKAFEDMGAEDLLHMVESGIEVLHYLDTLIDQAYFPSLIVLDVNMPLIDGFQTLCLLKENPSYRSIPVMMLSSQSEESFKKKCLEHSAVAYLLKPFRYDATFAKEILSKTQE